MARRDAKFKAFMNNALSSRVIEFAPGEYMSVLEWQHGPEQLRANLARHLDQGDAFEARKAAERDCPQAFKQFSDGALLELLAATLDSHGLGLSPEAGMVAELKDRRRRRATR